VFSGRRLIAYLTFCSVAATSFAVAASTADSGQPITDEALRLRVLNAVFPNMQISVVAGAKIDDSAPIGRKPNDAFLFFPDAMKEEKVYTVVGHAMNAAERAASSNVIDNSFSATRQVRIKLFHWPGDPESGMLAILQYKFPDANPPMSSPSLGVLAHVVGEARKARVQDEYLLETTHHGAIEGIRMADFNGDGANELVIESDWGGAGTIGSSLRVFDLSHGEFKEILDTTSRVQYEDQDWYTQVLDIDRTLQRRGGEFCFTKTVLFEMGKPYHPPRVIKPCYKRGDGVDLKETRERNASLKHLR
jgi:hypothetical protein